MSVIRLLPWISIDDRLKGKPVRARIRFGEPFVFASRNVIRCQLISDLNNSDGFEIGVEIVSNGNRMAFFLSPEWLDRSPPLTFDKCIIRFCALEFDLSGRLISVFIERFGKHQPIDAIA